MAGSRAIDERYVERAEAVVRRVMGVPEDTVLRAERWVFDLRALVAGIAVELEVVSPADAGEPAVCADAQTARREEGQRLEGQLAQVARGWSPAR